MSTVVGNRYRLERELGAGGMGRVWLATDMETNQPVAAKLMLAGHEDDLPALLRFYQEGAVLSTLKHPNIVEVLGTYLEGETCSIIMELLEGQSLGQLLHQTRLTPDRIKHISTQVGAALVYAHGRGIIHRDIKPDNIMVVSGDRVKVTDFGIARILQSGSTLNTKTGMSLGTPLYMSPEQIEGVRVDGRADIYSFGCVVYHMVTGHPPFEGDDPLTIAFKHVHRAPAPPSQVADVPPDWEAVILRMLAKDPSDRFQTAAELETALGGLSLPAARPARPAPLNPTVTLSRQSVMTPPPKPAPAAQAFEPRVERARTAINPPTVSADAHPAPIATQPAVAEPVIAAPSRQSPTRHQRPLILSAIAIAVVVIIAVAVFMVTRNGSSSPAVIHTPPVWASAGTSPGQLNEPTGLARDSAGNVYVTEYGNNRVSKFSPNSKLLAVWTMGSAGLALNSPTGVSVDGHGNIFVADNGNHRVQELSPTGQPIFQWTGRSSAVGDFVPADTAVDSNDNLYVSDYDHGRVLTVPAGSHAMITWVQPGASQYTFHNPGGIGIDHQGDIWVVEQGTNSIVGFFNSSQSFRRIGTEGSGPAQFGRPSDIAFDQQDNLYVADSNNNRIEKLSPLGKFLGEWKPATGGKAGKTGPAGVAVDEQNNIYASDYFNGHILLHAPLQ